MIFAGSLWSVFLFTGPGLENFFEAKEKENKKVEHLSKIILNWLTKPITKEKIINKNTDHNG